jgi:polyisoprenoid-binding protein YceI
MTKAAIAALALSAAAILALAPEGRGAPEKETWEVDSVHSSLVFRVRHLGVSYVYGRFNDISGSLTTEGDSGSVRIEVDAASVDTNNSKRDDHLRGTDFFGVKQFPKIIFESTKFARKSGDTFEVTGKLTLHGVTKEITVPMERVGTLEDDGRGGARTGFHGTFTIDRADYGMDYRTDMLGSKIWVALGVEAIRK